jgi:hypothetical protein
MLASHPAVLIFRRCVWFTSLIGWILVALVCTPSAAAQHVSWAYEARFDGPLHREDRASAITADPFGNAYVTGEACVQLLGGSCNADEMATIKYDPTGHAVWIREFRGSVNAVGTAIAIDAAENVYVSGFETSQGFQGQGSAIIIKYGPTGNVIWTVHDPDFAFPLEIAVDSNGEVYIGGDALVNVSPNPFSFVAKYSAQGSRLWMSRVSASSDTGFDGFGIDREGNAYVSVTPNPPAGGPFLDTATVTYKFDATTGDKLWSASYNPSGIAIGPKFALSPEGSVYLSGFLNSDSKVFALRYNSDGQLQWTTTTPWPSGNFVLPTAISVDSSGNAYVAAADVNRGATGPDNTGFVTAKYSPTGALLWQAHYHVLNGPNAGFFPGLPAGIAVSPQGEVYVAGTLTGQDSPTGDYLTVKYDTNGKQIWFERFNGPGPNHDDELLALALSGGSVFVTGTSEGVTTSFDYLTIRYVQDAAQICVSSLTFAGQKVGTVSSPQTFTITNASETLLEFKGITASGDFIAKNDCPLMLSPGLSCTVSVTFSPKASGLRTGILTVSDDGVGSPQFVKLTGTGVE